MLDHWLANLVVLVHFAFLLFVSIGALAVLRWRWLAWVHVPAALWGVLIEFSGWICPLTPLENLLRRRAGEVGYEGGFIDHYVAGVIYPEGLTRRSQVVLGILVLAFNAGMYALYVMRYRTADDRRIAQ
jgi:hypothetical protein